VVTGTRGEALSKVCIHRHAAHSASSTPEATAFGLMLPRAFTCWVRFHNENLQGTLLFVKPGAQALLELSCEPVLFWELS
jgi:hypothetical protein